MSKPKFTMEVKMISLKYDATNFPKDRQTIPAFASPI